jgi:uncharacterized protein (TIRG00374 family)
MSKLKNIFIQALKLAFVGGLLTWMIVTDKLHLSSFGFICERPIALVWAFAIWLFGAVLIQGQRWRLLMRGLGIPCPFWRVAHLQLVGLFFNTAMPGAVGGDVIKALYIVRDQPRGARTGAAISVLVDRIVGLFGMFTIGAIAVTIDFSHFSSDPLLRSLMTFIYTSVGGMTLFMLLVLSRHSDASDPLLRLLRRDWPLFSTIRSVYDSLRMYRHRPLTILYAWGLSIVVQLLFFSFFSFLTIAMTGQHPPTAVLVTIYSIGALVTALPVAPGGLGVGHLAFEKLFLMVGLTGGANVFNIFCVTFLAFNLMGSIPYLMMRRQLNAVLDQPSTP